MNMATVIDILFKVALVYMAFLAVLFFMQRSMIYFPDVTTPSPDTFGAGEDLEVSHVQTDDGLTLKGWFFPPEGEKPVILFFHGNAQNHAYRIYKARFFLEEGYGVLLAGYRGYGGNPGQPSEEGFYRDGLAYLNWLREGKGIDDERIVLYGESLGSGVAVHLAAYHGQFAGIVLETPYTALTDVARKIYGFVPVRVLMRDQFRSIDKIDKVQAPVLVLIAGQDSVVPAELGKALYEAANEPKALFTAPNADHNDLYASGAALQVRDFLSNIHNEDANHLPLP